ncbi:hypothetical protein [Pseudooceanicola nanhaiensis]|uniref:hypothetical protein n=1 Tax=Pseudooceanicola nanhaiensis TaxID=375761 RepID=UPI001CD1CB08|nr:hypothetical protein [Pseudooceanicola nanhaiensis]MCA0919238.1 hypothetical protein [Pseudooceanicola nanhaiensis]
MTEDRRDNSEPTEALLQAWIYRDNWSLLDAVPLALGVTPDSEEASEVLKTQTVTLENAKRAGATVGSPKYWLWWGERNGLPFHDEWWMAVTPERPIGYDGRHLAFSRKQVFSERYLRQERRLIGNWARKPFWTPREAIDLSLNFDPFTTNGWQGEAPETGETIREREDRFLVLERALEIGAISEKASPLEYILWLEARGYYVSEAWRRAVGLRSENVQQAAENRSAELAAENEVLRRQLRERDARITELELRLRAEDTKTCKSTDEISRFRRRIKELSEDPASPSEKGAQAKRIASLEKALLAAVVDGHSYDPRPAKCDVHRQVADKAKELDFTLSAQTVRRYLQESADVHVDQGVWELIYPTK